MQLPMTTIERLRAESPFTIGRASALKTRERKRLAMQAAIKKRDWRRLKQVPNAERRHRSTVERKRLNNL